MYRQKKSCPNFAPRVTLRESFCVLLVELVDISASTASAKEVKRKRGCVAGGLRNAVDRIAIRFCPALRDAWSNVAFINASGRIEGAP